MSATLQEICRYPVKSLSADRLDAVTLTAGADGLKPVTETLQTKKAPLRPSVP